MKIKELVSMLDFFDEELEVILCVNGKDYPTPENTDKIVEGDSDDIIIYSKN